MQINGEYDLQIRDVRNLAFNFKVLKNPFQESSGIFRNSSFPYLTGRPLIASAASCEQFAFSILIIYLCCKLQSCYLQELLFRISPSCKSRIDYKQQH